MSRSRTWTTAFHYYVITGKRFKQMTELGASSTSIRVNGELYPVIHTKGQRDLCRERGTTNHRNSIEGYPRL